jgi:hypothetical protein
VAFVVFIILFWSFAYAVEKAKKEWRHSRDAYARDIGRANPGWHRQKIRRHARRRAVTWWAREAAEGFPVIRQAWAEDRDHVRYLRETDRISRETRLAELRAELDVIRTARDEHAAAVEAEETKLPFGSWYQQNADRIRGTGSTAQAPQALPANPPVPAGPPAAARPPRLAVSDQDRDDLIRRLAEAAASQDFELWPNPGYPSPAAAGPASAGGELDPAKAATAPGGVQRAADDFHAAVTEGRHEDAAAAHQRYRAAVDAQLAVAGTPATGPAPNAPGQPAGEPDRNYDHGGDGMTMSTNVPNGELTGDSPYRAAFTALEGYDQVAQQHEQAAETLEAQLTLHNFDRDAELMEQIRGLRETAGQIRSRAAQARQVLIDHHAAGDEYHRSGVDADATAFRS